MASTAVLAEKRPERLTIRLGDSLRDQVQRRAEENGTTVSNYVVHCLAAETDEQPFLGQTLSDELRAVQRLLVLPEKDGDKMTSVQRLFLIRRLARLVMLIAGGH